MSQERIAQLEKHVQELQQENQVLRDNKDFGLVWEKALDKKTEEIATHIPLLIEKPAESVVTSLEAVNHVLINGDNFHALTALAATHTGKVNVIYIDPPYNTGNKDFIYNDSYVNNDDIYKHSKWLSFMASRLALAYELLSDDGVIFVSIDDNEQAELKLLLDNIFKPSNFIANVPRIAKGGAGNDSKYLAVPHDYVLIYRKSDKLKEFTKVPVDMDKETKYRYSDEYVKTRGKYYLRNLQYKGTSAKKSAWGIELPNGETVDSDFNDKVGHEWRWGKEKVAWGADNKYLVFVEKDGLWNIYIKQYQYADNAGNIRVRKNPALGLMDFKNSSGTTEVRNILGPSFSYPKPVSLLKHLINLYPKNDALVLDFFAGSGTTGHAVVELNSEDNGTRQCVLVTDGGRTETHGDSAQSNHSNAVNIADEITYQRMKRAITGKNWKDGKEHKAFHANLHYLKVETLSIADIPNEEKVAIIVNKLGDSHGALNNMDNEKWNAMTDALALIKSWESIVKNHL